ncbi:MFS transporter [Berryella wangjianweii]|uniref:MFS transporter n=1 Tax=Berryella wangjianweii TaxID=2734634 RepID=A0A6M8J5J1_9ACTN|nr:MFS transporter [Berryella wangjianweii]QKF07226.1 MFS transporter [Berryella wangjianweii]
MTSPSASAPSTLTAFRQIDAHPLTRNQKSLIGLAVVGNVAEFFDMFLVGFVVALLAGAWSLTGPEMGAILACSGLGTVLGSVTWGRLSDSLGRRESLACCIVMFTGFTAASALLPDGAWLLFALMRVGVGFGVGGLNIVSIPYVQEFVPSRQRGFLSGLASSFIPAGLMLGSISQGIVGDDWRLLLGLGAAPIALLAWVARVPQSPVTLMARGREDEARASVAWALQIPVEQVGPLSASSGSGSDASVHAGTHADACAGTTANAGAESDPTSPPKRPSAERDERAQRRGIGGVLRCHLRPLVVIAAGSFCFMMGSFAIQSWGQTLLREAYGLGVRDVALAFGCVAICDMLGRLGCARLADAIGRKLTLLIFGLLGAAGCAWVALFHDTAWSFFAGILVIMTFGDGAFGILNAFGAEQFPTSVRSTALGLGYGLGATAKIVGPALVGALVGGSAISQGVSMEGVGIAFTLFGAFLAAGALMYQLARETRGKSLESL